MQVILFAQTLFGILFVIRTLQIFRARALLTTSFVTKTGTIFVSIAIFAALWRTFGAWSGVFLSCANMLSAWMCMFLCERRQIDALKSEIPFFLDRWILALRLGIALAPARERALRDHSENFQALIRPIFATGARAHAKLKHPLLSPALIYEFERIEREPHAALSRIENLRHTLRKAADFRRKSGQAIRQTRAQSTLMLIMLFALVVFTIKRYGWHQVSDLVALAVTLSLFGAWIMHLLARKSRWKI